jgi:ATP-dependent helicase/nuclease subunit A
MNLKIISAGAGSGKTYRLTSEMVDLVKKGVRPEGIIATTFTKKAAAELEERVRVRLLESGMPLEADQLTNALIGTVHGLGVKLLQRFAYEAGVSPDASIIADEDQQLFFNQALTTVLTEERVNRMEYLCNRLGFNKNPRNKMDWRREVQMICEVARTNGFGVEELEQSRERSMASFRPFLGEPDGRTADQWNDQLAQLLVETATRLENNEDATKKTAGAVKTLNEFSGELRRRGELLWHQWAKLSKLDVGSKSRDDVEDLIEFTARNDAHPQFHLDIQNFIDEVFALAQAALYEYDRFKKERGLIDYTDMEVQVNRLLDQPMVREVMLEELDLLMVDEFQDTSPIQLEIFLKLSRMANLSIWVGDPKQSIYGFRGAEPALMQAVIEATGGIRPEDIQGQSWRSREDIVYVVNAIFNQVFDLPESQIVLDPVRKKSGTPNTPFTEPEPNELETALHHWHFEYSGEGRGMPGRPWMENAIADRIFEMLDQGIYILPKGSQQPRLAQPGDVAVLCRSNFQCQIVAEALHNAGLKAAISRAGLLETAEATLLLACMKYILDQRDALSVAEILLLTREKDIETIIRDRDQFLQELEGDWELIEWARNEPYIRELNELRNQVVELSSAELLGLLVNELDLRRIIVAWGNAEQRLGNLEMLEQMAQQYEEMCNRLHSAASLGGFLLWLSDQAAREQDQQEAGTAMDTVQVVTYHRSKGLEYPIVICHSLENNLRGDVWGVHIEQDVDQVDLENVLGNRWLRYWVNPYADQFRKTRLEERLLAGEAATLAEQEALAEEARLLYVGLTRARDYLVLVSRAKKPTKWLNRVCHNGDESIPTLDASTGDSPWYWKEQQLPLECVVRTYPDTFAVREVQGQAYRYFGSRAGQQTYQNFRINLRKEDYPGVAVLGNIKIHSFASLLDVSGLENPYAFAKATKAMLTAFRSEWPESELVDMARGLLIRFEQDPEQAPDLVARSRAFYEFLEQRLGAPVSTPLRKYPLRYQDADGRLLDTVVDYIHPGKDRYWILQQSGFSGSEKRLKGKVAELASWLYLAGQGISEHFESTPVGYLVGFPLQGKVVEVTFGSVGQETTEGQMDLFS